MWVEEEEEEELMMAAAEASGNSAGEVGEGAQSDEEAKLLLLKGEATVSL